jgi:multidrug efflux pump subunit AcrA (membrane-fusion protein)
MIRKILISLAGLAILVGAVFIAMAMMNSKKAANQGRSTKQEQRKKVFAKGIKNDDILTTITASGTLVAKDGISLYSEVQGILRSARFNSGVRYRSGQVMMSIDNNEQNAAVTAQRSDFYNKVAQIMPDIKLDYQEVADKWDNYLKSIEISKPLPSLPSFSGLKEQNFITGRGVVASYHSAKNMEERNRKYQIIAPFNGIVTEANVQNGSLVSPGQKLGEFINDQNYELELALNALLAESADVGQEVQLKSITGDQSWKGKIVRINPKIDPNSQTLTVFIAARGEGLREGMFLEAVIEAGTIPNVYEMPRNLINSSNEIFVVENDSILNLQKIEIKHLKEQTALVDGLKDGSMILTTVMPNAYPGMKVKIISDN